MSRLSSTDVHSNMCINRGHTDDSLAGHRPPKANIVLRTGLDVQKDEVEHHIMHYWPIVHEHGNDQWHCHERQKNNYTFFIAETKTRAVAQ